MYKTEEWKTKKKKNNETALKSYVLWLETFSFLDYYFDNEVLNIWKSCMWTAESEELNEGWMS